MLRVRTSALGQQSLYYPQKSGQVYASGPCAGHSVDDVVPSGDLCLLRALPQPPPWGAPTPAEAASDAASRLAADAEAKRVRDEAARATGYSLTLTDMGMVALFWVGVFAGIPWAAKQVSAALKKPVPEVEAELVPPERDFPVLPARRSQFLLPPMSERHAYTARRY